MKRLPLHRRTRVILASLEKELGTDVPWADCFAEIAELDEAVRKCFEPAALDALAILDEPVEVGAVADTGKRWWQFWRAKRKRGTKFWALTLNAEDWFEWFCEQFPDAQEMQTAAWLYASAHSMEPESLPRMGGNKWLLAWRVWLWRCRCGVKRSQIAPLQALLMPGTPWPRGGSQEKGMERDGYAGYGWMMTPLCRLKNDPDWWRNKVPFLKAMQSYLDSTLYGEPDSDVRNARWEQWRTSAQAEEAVAANRLKAAWKAFDEAAVRPAAKTAPEARGGQEEAPEGRETAKEPEAGVEEPAER
jgi:hypothetical protein